MVLEEFFRCDNDITMSVIFCMKLEGNRQTRVKGNQLLAKVSGYFQNSSEFRVMFQYRVVSLAKYKIDPL